MSETSQATTPSALPQSSERFTALCEALEKAKAASALREVIQQDILMEMMLINRSRLDEFPNLEHQQKSVLRLIFLRGRDHPGLDFLRKRLDSFLALLNRYDKARLNGNTEETKALEPEMANLEQVILKFAQGVIYTMAFVLDNFTSGLVAYLGEEARQKSDEIFLSAPFDDTFWRENFKCFIADPMDSLYSSVISASDYIVRKTGGQFIIAFALDVILRHRSYSGADPGETSLQKTYREKGTEFASRKLHKALGEYFHTLPEIAGGPFGTATGLTHTARMACLDSNAERFVNMLVAKKVGTSEETSPEEFQLVKDSVEAIGVATVMTKELIKEDMTKALKAILPAETEALLRIIGDFEREAFDAAGQILLEVAFISELRKRLSQDSGRATVKAVPHRRLSLAALEKLETAGLSRIRRRQIFYSDPSKPEFLRFKVHSEKELRDQLAFLAIPEKLTGILLEGWKKADRTIDYLVVINLGLIAKTTTNVAAKLKDILKNLGIHSEENGEASGEEPEDSDNRSDNEAEKAARQENPADISEADTQKEEDPAADNPSENEKAEHSEPQG